jgi:hypothetical protein
LKTAGGLAPYGDAALAIPTARILKMLNEYNGFIGQTKSISN